MQGSHLPYLCIAATRNTYSKLMQCNTFTVSSCLICADLHVCESDHAHSLTSIYAGNANPLKHKNSHEHSILGPHQMTGVFLVPISCTSIGRINGPLSSEQGLSTAHPSLVYAVCTLQVNPPSSPRPTLFAHVKPISRGNSPSDVMS